MEIQNSSIFKLLFLLQLLFEGDKTKNEITEAFNLKGIKLNKPSINRYISILKDNDIKIELKKRKNQTLYSIKKEEVFLNLSSSDLLSLKNIKKRVIAQKNYDLIRKTMRFFYKIAMFIKSDEIKEELINFGYYSTINWGLVAELEKQALEKNLISIEYILKENERKEYSIYPKNLSIQNFSDRLYLNCAFENHKKISHLPIDKIFLIKKVLKEGVLLKSFKKELEYSISADILDEIELDFEEKIIKSTKELATIRTVFDDEFYIIQRLLSFCPDLYDISDKNIKKKVLEKLEAIKESYDS